MRLERPFGVYVGCIVLYFEVRGTIASVRVEARVVSGGASAGCEKGLAWRGDGHGSTQASRSKRVEIRFEVTHRRLPKTLVFSGGRTAMDPSHHRTMAYSACQENETLESRVNTPSTIYATRTNTLYVLSAASASSRSFCSTSL